VWSPCGARKKCVPRFWFGCCGAATIREASNIGGLHGLGMWFHRRFDGALTVMVVRMDGAVCCAIVTWTSIAASLGCWVCGDGFEFHPKNVEV
jgi:hypothetical protein